MFVLIGFLIVINYTSFNILAIMKDVIGYPISVFWRIFGL
jgi:hypothetical protein